MSRPWPVRVVTGHRYTFTASLIGYFLYFSLVLGMTFQVSDVQITSPKLRRLAAAQGLIGFLFNAVIIALTVNIGASLLS
jgi:uncharacterized membrane protein